MSLARVGIQIAASTPPADLGAIAAETERLGYGEIWLAEDYFELGGIASAGIVLAATERIPVGLGIVAGGVRHPAVTAMEFATLGRAYPNRFLGGIGHGVPGWMHQMGLKPGSPIRALREAVAAIGELLGGEELTRTGEYFTFDGVQLDDVPDEPVPLYLGEENPVGHQLDRGGVGDLVLEPHLVADDVTQLAVQLIGDAAGHGPGRQPPRLGMPDHTVSPPPHRQADFR